MKGILSALFLTCKKATELVEKQHTKNLTPLERAKLGMHLSMCKACDVYAIYSKKMELILAAVVKRKPQSIAESQKMEQLKERIKLEIEKL